MVDVGSKCNPLTVNSGHNLGRLCTLCTSNKYTDTGSLWNTPYTLGYRVVLSQDSVRH